MKTLFTSKELPHLWAHEVHPKGRCQAHKRFDGPSYYSYGTEIARILKRGQRKAYLLNETSYSVTTSGHQSGVRSAIPEGAAVFLIGGIGRGFSLDFGKETGPKLFEYAIEKAADWARSEWKKNSLAETKSDWLKQAVAVNEFFGLRRKVDARAIDRLKERAAAAQRRQEADALKAEERRKKEAAKQLKAWLAGEAVPFPYAIQTVYCRIHNDELETSRGVTVPLKEARRAYRFALKMKAKGWHRNGEQFAVGSYQLDAVNEHGIVAGCHRIGWPEIERIATLEGWTV